MEQRWEAIASTTITSYKRMQPLPIKNTASGEFTLFFLKFVDCGDSDFIHCWLKIAQMQPWPNEEDRRKSLQEKHDRGSLARQMRDMRIQNKEVGRQVEIAQLSFYWVFSIQCVSLVAQKMKTTISLFGYSGILSGLKWLHLFHDLCSLVF